MLEQEGNIFDHVAKGGVRRCIVIPTNTVQFKGTAVMGAGVAGVAAEIMPWLPHMYGQRLLTGLTSPQVFPVSSVEPWPGLADIMCLPTMYRPGQMARKDLIEDGLACLETLANALAWEAVYLPHLGCGIGQLNYEHDLRPMLEAYFKNDNRFIVVRYNERT